ncbi:hypothetical protein [Streptomyces sp. H39-S7]|uniref:hypothetical protein n=1 Tax=Streptomyces sp. H39-S7 TaxID=3004357 RepID=UPI0022B05C7D|nr:hypothetical protein [Streptomyces sp. H39-S7]MCZ4123681.1 hypothetical protein [Streptomyces sp. H39-S7]
MRQFAAVVLIAAASAVTGCATVPSQPAPEPSSAPALPALPLPEDGTAVRQPDLQSLATVPVERDTDPPTAAASAPPERVRPRHRAHPPVAPAGQDAVPAAKTAARPRPAASLPGGAGVCALGETYGGWAEDSDAARICHEAYGR